jgi:TatD DNase family protein
LAKDTRFLFATAGIHPNYSADLTESQTIEFAELAAQPEVVAIGEIGLDYYRDYAHPQQQLTALEIQLSLAQKLDLRLSFMNAIQPTNWHQFW